jgi:nucleotide-binding universal stress UspA family protein
MTLEETAEIIDHSSCCQGLSRIHFTRESRLLVLSILDSYIEQRWRHLSEQISRTGNSPAKFPPSRILVSIDGSKNSQRASDVAIELAKEYGSELIVLNVVPISGYVGETDISRQTFEQYCDYMESASKRSVDEVTSSAKNQGIIAVGEVLRPDSSIVETIVGAADKVDLIVIGTRGFGGFKKLVLGSVSSGVVAHANCNVLVVR